MEQQDIKHIKRRNPIGVSMTSVAACLNKTNSVPAFSNPAFLIQL
jgi:hypothetical protein